RVGAFRKPVLWERRTQSAHPRRPCRSALPVCGRRRVRRWRVMFVLETRRLFEDLADAAFSELKAGEALGLQVTAEDQTYVRFNDSKVRQATAVLQRTLSSTFQQAGRQVTFTLDLGGHPDQDRALLLSCLERARREAQTLPEDPFAVPLQDHGTSTHEHYGAEPDA